MMKLWQRCADIVGCIEISTHETGTTLESIGRYKGSVGVMICCMVFLLVFGFVLWYLLTNHMPYDLLFPSLTHREGPLTVGLLLFSWFMLWFVGLPMLFLAMVLLPFLSLMGAWTALRHHGEIAFRLTGTREAIGWGPHGTEQVIAFHTLQRVSLNTTTYESGGEVTRIRLHLLDGRRLSPPGDPEAIFPFLRTHFTGQMQRNGQEVPPVREE